MAAARRVIGVALLALLLAQWAALWHAVAHGPLQPAGAVHRAHAGTESAGLGDAAGHAGHHAEHHAAHDAAHQSGHHPRADPHATGADDHAGHAAGSPVCQLFDQLLLGQAPDTVGLLTGIDTRASEAPQARPASATPSTATKAYDARGPPRA